MANESPVERRKYPRIKTEVLAAIEREISPNVVAYAVDLSLGGIRFRYLGTGSEFEVDEHVRMSLRIGGADASVMGEVMRVNIYFILAMLVVLLLVTFFPALSLWLPRDVFGLIK